MRRILVIEDDAEVRSLYKRILEQAGHEVLEAPDGNVGIRLFKAHNPELIITDIIMPEKEGIETIMELRRDYPAVKIIAVSGGGQAAAGSMCLALAKRLGADRTLPKPFSRQDLLSVVADVLGDEVIL
jgi:CheY-like chemotaxis protein